MGIRTLRRFVAVIALVPSGGPAFPQDVPAARPPASDSQSTPRPAQATIKPAPSESEPGDTTAVEAVPASKSIAPSEPPVEAATTAADDAAAERDVLTERLKALPKAGDKDVTPATKNLREVLEERLKWLDEWDKAAKERKDAEHPRPSPETQSAEWNAELVRLKATLDQADKAPEVLLPVSLRKLPEVLTEPLKVELKEAIDAAQTELKKWTRESDDLRSEPTRKDGGALAALRARRDKTHQNVAGHKTRAAEREKAVTDAKTPEGRALAQERLSNQRWEARVEAERLKGLDAQIELEGKRGELSRLNLQVCETHAQIAKRTLDLLKVRYRAFAAREERDLRRAAVQEQTKAKRSDDPMERFRAKRSAELLELEAKVLSTENALATSPSPSLDEQRALADKADVDFTTIKRLLDDGRVSHLDALRLTNDFRRIGDERGRIVRNELAVTSGRLTGAENALSEVELEMIYDARDDRYELDALLERLPRREHARALALFDELERKHAALLNRRREALVKLADRAERTHEQVLRRLGILDDHFGFIRTHIFWVRDEEPLTPATAVQVQREVTQLGWAAYRYGEEAVDRTAWGRISPEFVAAVLGLTVLPWPLRRAHRALRSFGLPGRTAGPNGPLTRPA